MASSGSIDWTRTRDQIINRALRICGVLSQGDTPLSEMTSEGSEALNSMIKAWQSDGVKIWKVKWKTVAPVATSEVLGYASGAETAINYKCIKNLAASSADDRPITGKNWTDYWVVGGSSGATWVTATAYNAIGHIAVTDVLGITEAFWRDGDTDVPLELISRENYMALPIKGEFGTPSKLYLDSSVLGSPTIYLWPQPDVDVSTDLSEVLHYNAIQRLEDFDAGANTPDFDVKWIEAMVFNLAFKLAYEYQLPITDKQAISAEAGRLYELAKADATEYLGMELSVRMD